MQTEIKLQHPIKDVLAEEVRSGISNCYTCGSCLSECPVNLATDSLHPRTMVRMVSLGLIDELMHSPEIWYCISCGRCERACPMSVRPARLIAAIRQEAYTSRVLTLDKQWRLRSVYSQLHRVRRQVVELCFNGEPIPDLTSEWRRLAEAPFSRWVRKNAAACSNEFITGRAARGAKLPGVPQQRRFLLHLRRMQQRLSGCVREGRF